MASICLAWTAKQGLIGRILKGEAPGTLSHGPELVGEYRLVAGYVDRVLEDEKPASLPSPSGARPYRASHAARARRRGDRISIHVGYGHLADIQEPPPNVRSRG